MTTPRDAPAGPGAGPDPHAQRIFHRVLPATLADIRQALMDVRARFDGHIDSDAMGRLELVLAEVLNNIALHGSDADDGRKSDAAAQARHGEQAADVDRPEAAPGRGDSGIDNADLALGGAGIGSAGMGEELRHRSRLNVGGACMDEWVSVAGGSVDAGAGGAAYGTRHSAIVGYGSGVGVDCCMGVEDGSSSGVVGRPGFGGAWLSSADIAKTGGSAGDADVRDGLASGYRSSEGSAGVSGACVGGTGLCQGAGVGGADVNDGRSAEPGNVSFGDQIVIHLTVTQHGGGLACAVVDNGKPLPESCLSFSTSPPAPEMAAQRAGGFGWFIIRDLTCALFYFREEPRNVLCFNILNRDAQPGGRPAAGAA